MDLAQLPRTSGGGGDTGGRRERWRYGVAIQEHEVVKAMPKERVPQRIVEQIDPSVLVDGFKDRIAEESADVPAPQTRPGIGEVMQLVLVERIKNRVADLVVDIPVHPVMEDTIARLPRGSWSHKNAWNNESTSNLRRFLFLFFSGDR